MAHNFDLDRAYKLGQDLAEDLPANSWPPARWSLFKASDDISSEDWKELDTLYPDATPAQWEQVVRAYKTGFNDNLDEQYLDEEDEDEYLYVDEDADEDEDEE